MLHALFATLVLAAPGGVQDAASADDPARYFESLVTEYERQRAEFRKAILAGARSGAPNRPKVKAPRPDEWAPRFQALAEGHAKTEIARKAWLWIVDEARQSERVQHAIDMLLADHIESEGLAELCLVLEDDLAHGPQTLRNVIAWSPHRSVQGTACWILGRITLDMARTVRRFDGLTEDERNPHLKKKLGAAFADVSKIDAAELEAQAETLLDRVAREFADVNGPRGSIAAWAQRDLFEVRNLSVGRMAPDIVGEDIEGVAFKLSDYLGKVVVVDFWGDW